MKPHHGHAVAIALLVSACGVPQDKYDTAVRSANDAKAASTRCTAESAQLRADVARLTSDITSAQALVGERDKSVADARRDAQFLQTRLDGATAETAELKKELEHLGKNADALLAEKGTLSGALADAKARLEELRKAQAAADARAALYRQLALKFQKMIDAGSLAIALRDGRMVLRLPMDILFESGQTDLKREGRETLAIVGPILSTFAAGRHFQVAGNTDNVPIQTARFPSNWELSTARAVEVVRFLLAHGMKPDTLAAAGYGEFDPVQPNDTPAGRAKNRRIEITLQPNIDELVAVPDAK